MVRTCLAASLLSLAAIPFGCVRDSPQSVRRPSGANAPSATAASVASSAPEAAASPPVASAAAPTEEPIQVYLESVSAKSGELGQLFVAAPIINLRQAVHTVSEPFVCVAAQPGDPIKSARLRPHDQRRLIEASCTPGARTHPYVEVIEDALMLFPDTSSAERVALPPGRSVVLDPILHARPTTDQCARATGDTLEVHVEHTDPLHEYPGGRGLLLRIPSLNISVRLFTDANAVAAAHSAAVYTRVVRPRGLVLDVVGASDGQSAVVWLTAEEGLLRVRTTWIDKVSSGRETFGAIRLPCTSTVRWKTKFARNDNPYSVPACYRACFEAHRRCVSACYERFADDRGQVAEPGTACERSCGDSSSPCFARCDSASRSR